MNTCCDCGEQIKRESRRCRSCAAKLKWRDGTLLPSPTNRVTLICEVCAKPFDVIAARSKARACSRMCANELRRWVRGEDHPLHKKPVELTCENCHSTFDAKPCFADGTKRFCSRECVGAWVTSNQPRVSSIEVATAAWLDERGINYRQQVRVGRFVADFVVGNTIVEVDGDYWHSLPKVIARDERKRLAYRRAGFRLIRIPEHEVRAGNFSALEGLAA